MSKYIPDAYRLIVLERAHYLCEYCLVHHHDNVYKHQIDHIISLKQGGITHPDNLASTCIFCNRYKGTNVGAWLPIDRFVRLYNPRIDKWFEHFEWDGPLILPRTESGEASVKILRLNDLDRLIERDLLIKEGRYPHPNALKLK
jgi:HNH endonuclease